jgi:hypothetical protein
MTEKSSMDLTEVTTIVAGIMASLGGAGAIILGLSSYLGKIWADKYMRT